MFDIWQIQKKNSFSSKISQKKKEGFGSSPVLLENIFTCTDCIAAGDGC